MDEYHVIGVMSGTSLDGLDIAYCRFAFDGTKWKYEIEVAETYEYDSYWKDRLTNAKELPSEKFLVLHNQYGEYIGETINKFIKRNKCSPDIISSHGHTIFHQPDIKFTFQIGNGASIAAKTGISTVTDFRTLDIALGGQGAPLVPIGDLLLFFDYDCCLNLGGFANISFTEKKKQIAFDICPCNIAINYMTNKIGLPMDKGGEIGKRGSVVRSLLEQLGKITYYSKRYPKSLGKEWLEREFIPIIDNTFLSYNDIMRTLYEHISEQIAKTVKKEKAKVLVTGGGAFNDFLITLLKEKTKSEIIIPEKKLINFKEALIFALLGLLRYQGKVNCLSSVTGASKDISGGAIYL